MKNHCLKIVFVACALPVFAKADVVASPEVYSAIESLSKYVQQKDDSFNAGVMYRKILENTEEKGVVEGLAIPIGKFYLMEKDPAARRNLKAVLSGINIEVEEESATQDQSDRHHRNNQHLVVDRDKCVSTCIDDVLDGAQKGAVIGGAIGAGGGPHVGAAGAAGGAVIGGALGGVQCSTKPECKDDGSNKRISTFAPDRARIYFTVEGNMQKKMKIVVNNGHRIPGGF
ncbi:hypothetical protein [Bdellovibrio bacteriovorus]|uniref:Glycine zipper domain-containing protein n=1 Tax=Bdellovibrio bacteriovorus TaxID=959 RepID=A0A1Z3NBK0_BDEBC|nr:hypothetical protein [Bdellovibrio bacteriovorus]ASD64817.1 hypothetical protein B9G79_15235 [Bdellovibrio bacteriovorus]